MITRHLTIRGRVQGVGFRYSMQQEALRLGVTGWVRNRRDGSVEAVVQGDEAALDALVAWAKHGPAGAHVTNVEIAEGALENYGRFETRATA